MTPKDRYLISTLVDRFVQMFENQPGILDINSDETLGPNVVVVVDSRLFKWQLPEDFHGLHIHTIDVRRLLKNGRKFIDKAKKSNIDLTDETNYRACHNFVRAVELCQTYVHPKKERPNEQRPTSTTSITRSHRRPARQGVSSHSPR